MEPKCLICFKSIEKQSFVSSDAQTKMFSSCNKYLHSTITKETLKNIQLDNENYPPLCKPCFDSALELTQLSEQLSTIETDILDLALTFSMAVCHRRSQNNTRSFNDSSIIEFHEACLPPNVFSTKNTNHNNNIIINTFQSNSDITNVKRENSDLQFDDLAGSSQAFITNGTSETQINTNEENIDKHCKQSTIEQNNNAPASEIRIVHEEADENVSNNCANPNKRMQPIMSLSDVSFESVKTLERVLEIKFDAPNGEVSVENSLNILGQPGQKLPGEVLSENEELSGRSHASGREKLKCFYCEETFDKEHQRNNHHATHAGDMPYKCSFCELIFARRSKQKTHEKSHGINKPINCSVCEKSFPTQATLQNHQRIHKAEKGFQGSICKKRFAQLSDRKVHKRIHTEEKTLIKDVRSLRSSKLPLKESGSSHTEVEKPLTCSYCEKQCKSPFILKIHERTHTGDKPFKCSYCEKLCKSPFILKIHERTHTGDKPFKCSICEKRFAKKSGLTNHERIHTGEKPYKCSYCEKTFSQCSNKKTHEKIHHKQLPR